MYTRGGNHRVSHDTIRITIFCPHIVSQHGDSGIMNNIARQ